MQKKLTLSLVLLITLTFAVSCGSKIKYVKSRKGNVETVNAMKGSTCVYKLVYTYNDANKKIKGEYYTPQTKSDKKKKKKTNLFTGTKIAKTLAKWLADSKPVDESDIKLGSTIKDEKTKKEFVLRYAKKISYNAKGLPVKEIRRGYTDIPIVGRFLIKTNLAYTYNARGSLTRILEKNMNVDTLLLKFGVANNTSIQRDGRNRPTKVTKVIGSVPPTTETTRYYYRSGKNLRKTVYEKADINITKLQIVPTQRVTIWYNPGVKWDGMRKFYFSLMDPKNAVKEFWIYDMVKRKNHLDLRGFSKKSHFQKIMLVKKVYDLYQAEMKGPGWRLGDLPDVPKPFLMIKNMVWW